MCQEALLGDLLFLFVNYFGYQPGMVQTGQHTGKHRPLDQLVLSGCPCPRKAQKAVCLHSLVLYSSSRFYSKSSLDERRGPVVSCVVDDSHDYNTTAGMSMTVVLCT